MADELGVSVDAVAADARGTATRWAGRRRPVEPDHDRDIAQEFPATPEFQPDRMCEQRQLQTTLARAMSCLPERYQKVVFLYYTNDMTMKEIGDVIGVNESRVSQIHKTALKKMAVGAGIGRHSLGRSVLTAPRG